MNNDIIIVIYCETGFGNHYTNLINGFNHYLNIKCLGYNPKILISKGHKYFPIKLPLSVIYDYSEFQTEIIEVPFYELSSNLIGFENIYSSDNGQIWVKLTTKDLINYCSGFQKIDINHIKNFENQPKILETLFINQIYENSKSLMMNKENVIGIQFRGEDILIDYSLKSILDNHKWSIQLNRISKKIEENRSKNIFISSINRSVCDFFEKKYDNVFTHKFFYENMPTHNIFGHYDYTENAEPYIQNSIDILTEMVSFSYCEKIYSYGQNLSSFLLYGLMNNKKHTNWFDKQNKIIE